MYASFPKVSVEHAKQEIDFLILLNAHQAANNYCAGGGSFVLARNIQIYYKMFATAYEARVNRWFDQFSRELQPGALFRCLCHHYVRIIIHSFLIAVNFNVIVR